MALTDCTKTIINGISFTGYSNYDVVNSLTYVTSPERATAGNILGLDIIPTFIATTIQITYNLMPYETYKKFIQATTTQKEFEVVYFDPDTQEEKTALFYIAPFTKKQILFKSKSILGIRDFTIELISTNNEV